MSGGPTPDDPVSATRGDKEASVKGEQMSDIPPGDDISGHSLQGRLSEHGSSLEKVH